jgi:hypothetical protein
MRTNRYSQSLLRVNLYGKPIWELKCDDVGAMALNGTTLYATQRGALLAIDVRSGKILKKLDAGMDKTYLSRSIAILGDGQAVIFGDIGNLVRIDVKSGKLIGSWGFDADRFFYTGGDSMYYYSRSKVRDLMKLELTSMEKG